MTEQEPIDQIVRFFNDIDLPEVSIFPFRYGAYAEHMLTIHQDDSVSTRISESDSDAPENYSDVSDNENLKDNTEQEIDQNLSISALFSMGLSAVCSQLDSNTAYAKYMQSDIEKYGLVVSSNGRSKITADEVQEHILMPDYPHTKILKSQTGRNRNRETLGMGRECFLP